MTGVAPDTESRRAGRMRDLLAIGIIAAVWIAMVVIANPRGEFPLNDDWCYALTVQGLVEDGTFRMVSIVTMSLITQVLWGALFCLPFGFSFSALRISTLVAGLGGLIGAYLLLKELGAGRKIALIGTLVVAVNPIYFGLSSTFMTDVPFYTLSVFAVYASVRSLNGRSEPAYAASIVLAVLAVLLRQAGLALPIAFGVAYLVRDGVRLRGLVRAALPLVITSGALMAYQYWLLITGNLSPTYGFQTRMMARFLGSGIGSVISDLYTLSLTAIAYLGLFLFPLLVLASISRWKSSPSIPRAVSFVVLAVAIRLLMLPYGWRGGMPLDLVLGCIMTPFGMGPMTLADVISATQAYLLPFPPAFWSSVTIISAIGAALLLIEIGSAVKILCRRCQGSGATDKSVLAMMLAGAVMSLAPIAMLLRFAYFDRYFLALMPFLMGLVMLVGRPVIRTWRPIPIFLVMLMLGAAFSVCTTHDYLAWNRARWSAISYLMSEQYVPPSEIDGGYEFNGLYNYENRVREGFWREVDSQYAVTFAPVEGYEVLDGVPSGAWIPRGVQGVLILMASD